MATVVEVAFELTAAEFAAAPDMSVSATADLATEIELAAAPDLSVSATADLFTAVGLAATAEMAVTAVADLATEIELGATPAATVTAEASLLAGDTALAAAPAFSGSASAAFLTAIQLAALATTTGDAWGTLGDAPEGEVPVGAFPFASVSVEASLETAIAMAASPVASVTAMAALEGGIRPPGVLRIVVRIAARVVRITHGSRRIDVRTW
jgi:hypothetical protein